MQFAHITCSLHTNMATHRHTGPSDRRHITRITNIALTQTRTLHSQVLPNITLTQTRTLHARRVFFDLTTFVVAHITHADRIDQSYYGTYRQLHTHTCPPLTYTITDDTATQVAITDISQLSPIFTVTQARTPHSRRVSQSVLRCHHTEYCSTIVNTVPTRDSEVIQ